MVIQLHKGVPKNKDFFHLPPVSTTPVVHLELRISPRIFEKIRIGPFGILRGFGETDSSRKSRGTVPLIGAMQYSMC